MYSHKLQNATPHDLVAHGMWSVGGGARDFGPSSSCISPPPVDIGHFLQFSGLFANPGSTSLFVQSFHPKLILETSPTTEIALTELTRLKIKSF